MAHLQFHHNGIQVSAVADKPVQCAALWQMAKSKNGHVTTTMYVILLVTLDVAYLCKKFDNSSFSYS